MRLREHLAHPASGGAPAAGPVPGRLPPHHLSIGLELGSSHRQHVRAGSGEVDVGVAVLHLVARAVVAGGHAHGDAQERGRLKALIDRLARRRGEVLAVLGQPPTDRDGNGAGGDALDDLVEQVDPALLVKLREVDDDVGRGAQAGDDLDVHVDLARGLQHLFALVGREGHDLLLGEHRHPKADLLDTRLGTALLLAERRQVRREVGAAELGDGHRLALALPGGESVTLREVPGRQRSLRQRLGGPLVGRDPGHSTRDATLIEAEHTGDDVLQRSSGISRLPSRPAELAAILAPVDPEVGLERRVHLLRRTPDPHAARRG